MATRFSGPDLTREDPRPDPRRWRVLAGVVAGVAGLAVSFLATALIGLRASPVLAMAEWVITVTPGAVVELTIGLVGKWNKTLLVAGVVLAALLLSALAGLLTRRGRAAGAAVFLAMGVSALAAVVTRNQFEPLDLVPVVAGTATWVGVLLLLVTRLSSSESATGGGRRGFLLAAAVATVAAAAMGAGGVLVSRTARGVDAARRTLARPVTDGTVPAGADLGVEGVAPWRTPNEEFYRIDTSLVVPVVDPDTWRLRIHGMVDTEVEVTYADLMELELTEHWVTICCVSNEVGGELIGNAWWSGVKVSDLLARAGVQADADAVRQTSVDGWNCGTPIEALTDDRDAILAIAMNGEPLPADHGFPARMIVPGLYGYVSATKWVTDLEVTRFDRFDAYWTMRGWSELGPIKTQSRIGRPAPDAVVDAGTVAVGGHAWAQHLGIERVEYQLDGGPWTLAELGRVPGVDTWVQWAGKVEAGPGEHTLAVRATDLAGETQTSVRTDVIPNGATGWHTVSFVAEQPG